MEKRFILVIVLSTAVLWGWSLYLQKTQPDGTYRVANEKEIIRTTQIKENPVTTKPSPLPEVNTSDPAKPTLFFSYNGNDFGFIEKSATLSEVKFNKYQGSIFSLKKAFSTEDQNLRFVKQATSDKNKLVFVHSDSEKTITKEFVFDGYAINMRDVKKIFKKSSYKFPLVRRADFSGNATNQDTRILLFLRRKRCSIPIHKKRISFHR